MITIEQYKKAEKCLYYLVCENGKYSVFPHSKECINIKWHHDISPLLSRWAISNPVSGARAKHGLSFEWVYFTKKEAVEEMIKLIRTEELGE
jgi:hypothetical protein